MMRKKGIIILVVILVIFAVIAFFVRDRYIERAIEKTGQAIAGGKVEIDNFHFSLFKMECSWDRLQVANKNDTWYNVLETGKASLDIEARPLFWKRIIIKEMILENLRSGTRRETDGRLPKKSKPAVKEKPGMVSKAVDAIDKKMRELPVFDLSGLSKELKIDVLIDVNSLATVQEYDKLKTLADSSYNYWQTQLESQDYLKRAQKVEKNIKSLNLDKINDIASFTAALKKLDDIQKEVKSLRKDVVGNYNDLSDTFTELQTKLKTVQSGLKNDIERAKQLARIKDLDVKDVSLLLFGEPVLNNYERISGYVELGRKYMPAVRKAAGAGKAEKPPRFKGQNIQFPFHHRYPRFLLREAKFSAATEAGDIESAYFIEGSLTGLTNQPSVYGKPTRFNMGIMKVSGNRYNVSGSIDHTTEVAHDSVWVSAKNFAIGKVKLKKSKYFPNAIDVNKGNIVFAGFFIGDSIDIDINFDAAPVNFLYEQETGDRISRIVRDVLAGLTQLTLNAHFSGNTSDYKMHMSSNVDKVLANQVKKTLQKNLQEAQQRVENYVREEIGKRQKEVEAIVEKNRQKLFAEMDKAKQEVQEKVNELEKHKKEIEKRIEQETNKAKDKVMDKAKDTLKGLLKKR